MEGEFKLHCAYSRKIDQHSCDLCTDIPWSKLPQGCIFLPAPAPAPAPAPGDSNTPAQSPPLHGLRAEKYILFPAGRQNLIFRIQEVQ